MAYVSLYRKYRPQTFEDVVGQEHVTTTLRNAIAEGRVASGYLFTGTRGTAKTTCARIVAKALNCIGPDGKRVSPTPEPCGACGPCRSIAASSFVDVLEMDAASHGKVDDVRDLVASIKFPPMEGRYKVYIIDEAHQLSRDAMDAFLKTLEEPPAQVVFILATTELDKLPITIASRCQVFEFKRGSVAQISARLSDVLATESVEAEPAAVTLVARAADGSYRDSLSLLEQVLAYNRTKISVRDVSTVLGSIDEDVLSRTVDVMAASDAAGAFTLAGEILESGKDVRQFLKSLSGRVRDLLFVGVGAQPVSVGDMDDSAALRAQAARFSPAALMTALEALTEAEQETKRTNQHRLLLEMTLLRLMRLPQTASAPTAYVAPTPAAVAAPVPIRTPLVPEPPSPVQVNGFAAPIDIAAAPTPALPTELESPADTAPPLLDEDLEDGSLESDLLDDGDLPDDSDLMNDLGIPDFVGVVPSSQIADTLPLDAEDMPALLTLEDEPPSLLVTDADEHDAANGFMQVQQVAAAPEVAPSTENYALSTDPDTPPELIQLQKSWQEVINRMSSRSPASAALVKDGRPVGLVGRTFRLEFGNPLYVDKLEGNEKGRRLLEDVINKTLHVEPGVYKIKSVLHGTLLPASIAMGTTPHKREAAAAPAAHSPFLDEVIAVFGGKVLDDPEPKG